MTRRGRAPEDDRLVWFGVVQPVPGDSRWWMGWLEAEYSNGKPSMLRTAQPLYRRSRARLERKLRKLADRRNTEIAEKLAAEAQKERI